MFWKKRREPDKPGFQHYVAIGLSMNLPRVFEEKAKQKDFPALYRSLMELLASETFIMGCMIGTCRSDIITGIYRQNGEDYEQSMAIARDGLSKMIAVGEQRGEISLNALASSFARPEISILPKDNPVKGISIEVINSLAVPFLFGCILGHDHPQRFLEMLNKSFQEIDVFLFPIGWLSIYGSLVEEGDRSFLLNTNGLDEMRSAHENGTLPQKLVSIYRGIALKMVRDYELTVGLLK